MRTIIQSHTITALITPPFYFTERDAGGGNHILIGIYETDIKEIAGNHEASASIDMILCVNHARVPVLHAQTPAI